MRYDQKIELALDLLEAAKKWRTSYTREQVDPDVDIYAYDLRRTSFGDDAFDILMDFTDGLDEWMTTSHESPIGSPSPQHPSYGSAD